jgi:O-antigen/teichoic acid export membrane protein
MTLTNYSVAQGLKKFTGMVVSNLISSLGKLIFGVILVYIGYSVLGAMVGIVLGAVLAYWYSEKYIKQFVKEVGKGDFDINPLLKFAGPTLLQALAFTGYFTIDILLVKHFLPESDAGSYAALSTLGKILYFAVSPISSVMFPIVSNKYAKQQPYARVFLAAIGGTTGVAACILLGYYLFPDLIITLLYGSKYPGIADELVLMGIFMAFYSISYFLMSFLLSIGRLKPVVLSLLVGLFQIVLITLNHSSLREVITMNIYSMATLLVGLFAFVIYNYQQGKSHA